MALGNTFVAERYKEWNTLATNAEHVVDWEVIPRGADLRYQQFRIAIDSVATMPLHCVAMVDLTCWWIPVHGADAAETVNTVASLKNLYDMRVPKTLPGLAKTVDSNNPSISGATRTGAANSNLFGDDDWSLGDDDNNLWFDPGHISLAMIENAGMPAKMYSRRQWLGRDLGSGEVIASGGTVGQRYKLMHDGYVRRGLYAESDGYMVWILTIPGAIDDGDWTVSDQFPADQEFASLSFLAPQWSPMPPGYQYGSSGESEMRRWISNWLIEGDGSVSGDECYRPTNLRVKIIRHAYFRQNLPTQKTVSINA